MAGKSDAILREYKSLDYWSDLISWGCVFDGPVLLALLTGNPAVGLFFLLPWFPIRMFLGHILGFGLWPWDVLEKAKDGVWARYQSELEREKSREQHAGGE
jgi:hypothetical protein